MIRVVLILSAFLIYTGFKALQLSPLHPYLMISITIIFFLSMIASMFVGRSKPAYFEMKWFMFLTWIGSLFMGFLGTFILISIPIDVIHGLISLIAGKTFFTQEAYQIIFSIVVFITLLGFLQVLLGPKIKNVTVSMEALPKGLEGLTIAQISDLHIGPTIQSRYVEKVVRKTNATNADIIVITGDLVDSHTASIKKHLQPLRNLKSRYGVFYVTGNHEYYWGIDSLLPELVNVEINVLMNTNKIIEHNGHKLMIAGIPDPMGRQFSNLHKPDIESSRKSGEKTDLNILLAHRPDPYESAEKLGFDIQFSGHTHAGQFFPFSLLIPIAHKYYRGLNRHGKMWLYVNPGTGYWGPANRFGIASEITLVKLSKS